MARGATFGSTALSGSMRGFDTRWRAGWVNFAVVPAAPGAPGAVDAAGAAATVWSGWLAAAGETVTACCGTWCTTTGSADFATGAVGAVWSAGAATLTGAAGIKVGARGEAMDGATLVRGGF